MISAIDKEAIKQSGEKVGVASSQDHFSAYMGALAPAGGQSVSYAGEQNGAVVTQAAMSGLAGATAPYNAPYMGAMGVPGAGVASPVFTPGGGGSGAGGATAGGGVAGAEGTPFSNPSQDFLEKDYLLRQMQDHALNMLVLQAQVQDQNREFTLVSNMLQTRDRTLHTMIQNIGSR